MYKSLRLATLALFLGETRAQEEEETTEDEPTSVVDFPGLSPTGRSYRL